VGSLLQFEEYAGPLLRGHLSAGKDIGGIGFLKGVENADYFLHNLILRWLIDSGGGGSRGLPVPGNEIGRRMTAYSTQAPAFGALPYPGYRSGHNSRLRIA